MPILYGAEAFSGIFVFPTQQQEKTKIAEKVSAPSKIDAWYITTTQNWDDYHTACHYCTVVREKIDSVSRM